MEDGCEIYFYPLDDFYSSTDISTLQYSINGSDEWIYCESSPGIVINKDDYVSFKGDLVPIELSIGDVGIGNFNISSLCNLTGNCNSILFGDDAAFNFDLTGYDYCYSYLFGYCPVVEISPTFLPNTTLADRCYEYMFSYCTSLEVAPKLPATTLKSGCYLGMFDNCTSLTTAPELPATTLAEGCYSYMFYNTSVLPDCSNINFNSSDVVASGGLQCLFAGTKVTDSDLRSILPINSNDKYYLPTTELVHDCYSCMFDGCTSLTTAPELPATTLKTYCYANMFSGCTSLTTAPELPATVLADGCYSNMFSFCESLTTAPSILPATTLADSCYSYMFYICTSLTTAPELPATTLADSCYKYMFQDCISLTKAPELPATTLVSDCYECMLRGCSKLNYIKAMFTTTPSNTYTYKWVDNVASSGTFIKNINATWDVTGTNGIPSGWTVRTYGANASINGGAND